MANQRTTRFAFEITGNPATNPTKIKQLGTVPFFLIGTDNPLFQLMPEALNTTDFAPKVGVSVKDIMFLTLGGVAMAPEVANGGIHFVIDPCRLTKFFTDIDAQLGAEYIPIHGGAATAMPRAARVVAGFIANLPIELRLLVAADVLYDGSADDAGSDTCFDWFTPKMLITGEGHERHELLAQFILLFPEYYYKGTPSTGGRSSSPFIDVLDQIISAVAATGRDIAELAPQAQAAAIVAWYKRTRAPVMLMPYVSSPSLEVERRTADTHAGRLEPLLADAWRHAFPLLDFLWPNPVAEIGTEIGALATSLNFGGLSSGLTIEVIIAVTTALKDLNAFAVGKTNAERTAEIVRASKNATNDKEKDISAESKLALQADGEYIDLKSAIAGFDLSVPIEIAKFMLRHKHPVGILYMNNKFAPDDFWKRLKSVTGEAVVHTCRTSSSRRSPSTPRANPPSTASSLPKELANPFSRAPSPETGGPPSRSSSRSARASPRTASTTSACAAFRPRPSTPTRTPFASSSSPCARS
jgi:hypothetical protein